MSLSTLAGTTWLINEQPDTSEYLGALSVNFIYGDNTSSSIIEIGYQNEDIYYYPSDWYKACDDGVWKSTYDRIVTFIDGQEISNGTLIAWFEDNAVQIPTDLTGTSWLINDSPDVSTDADWNGINFTSDGNSSRSYTRLRIRTSALRYYYSSTGYSTAKSSTAWTSEGYKTIHITGGSLVEDENLIFWLVNNATQIIDDAKLYVGVNNLSSKLGNKYIGVNNQSRKLVKGYIGVNNLSQKIF